MSVRPLTSRADASNAVAKTGGATRFGRCGTLERRLRRAVWRSNRKNRVGVGASTLSQDVIRPPRPRDRRRIPERQEHMSLRVSGKNINIGEALRTHVTERLEQTAAKYFDGDVSGHVTIAPEGSGFRADCSLHLTSGIVLQADGRAQEPYASFDQAADRIEKRLRRYKSRLKSHHDAGHDAANRKSCPSYVLEAPDEESAPQRISPRRRRRDDDTAAPPVGVGRGSRPRSDRRAGRGVPPRQYGAGQCCLPARATTISAGSIRPAANRRHISCLPLDAAAGETARCAIGVRARPAWSTARGSDALAMPRFTGRSARGRMAVLLTTLEWDMTPHAARGFAHIGSSHLLR